jgi:hypothetical protein
MPQNPSANACSPISNDLFDLNLPEIGPGDEPLPAPAPGWKEQFAHAEFLLSCQPPDFHEKRLARMNPEPFVMP